MARQYDQAIQELKKGFELEPTSYILHWHLVYTYGMKEMYEQCLAAAQKALDLLGPAVPFWKTVLGHAHAFAGNLVEAEKIADEAIALSDKTYVGPCGIAIIYALLKERDKAFKWLEKAYVERDHFLCTVKEGPYFENLRPDPRFKELLKKMGLE